jgi:probable phosphoglycerate mutase
MRVLIIRHGDPYYPTDSLTEKGEREAALLGERLMREHVTHVYVSPLGRAKKTAEPFLAASGLTPVTLAWLHELSVTREEREAYGERWGGASCEWDLPPLTWTKEPHIFDRDGWRTSAVFDRPSLAAQWDAVREGWDALLAAHGYTREDAVYRVGEGWEDKHETLALFCHLGMGNLLLSQILNVSLPAVWLTLFLPTSSVTTVFMERHRSELPIAHARLAAVGDTSHLYAGGEPISASGLFADTIR